MKKYVLSLVAILAISSFAYGALTKAADTGTAADGSWFAPSDSGKITFPANTTNGPLIQFTPSANVSMAYDCDDGTVYSFGSYHSAGTKAYGTSSTDAKIYMKDLGAPPGDTAPTVVIPTISSNAVSYGAGWSAIK